MPPFEEKEVVSLDHFADRGGGNRGETQSRRFRIHKRLEFLLASPGVLFPLGLDEGNHPGINPHGTGGLGTSGGRYQNNEMVVPRLEAFPPNTDGLPIGAKRFFRGLLSIGLVEGENLHALFQPPHFLKTSVSLQSQALPP